MRNRLWRLVYCLRSELSLSFLARISSNCFFQQLPKASTVDLDSGSEWAFSVRT